MIQPGQGSIVQLSEGSFSGLIIAATFKHHLHNHEQFHIQIRTKMASYGSIKYGSAWVIFS